MQWSAFRCVQKQSNAFGYPLTAVDKACQGIKINQTWSEASTKAIKQKPKPIKQTRAKPRTIESSWQIHDAIRWCRAPNTMLLLLLLLLHSPKWIRFGNLVLHLFVSGHFVTCIAMAAYRVHFVGVHVRTSEIPLCLMSLLNRVALAKNSIQYVKCTEKVLLLWGGS